MVSCILSRTYSGIEPEKNIRPIQSSKSVVLPASSTSGAVSMIVTRVLSSIKVARSVDLMMEIDMG